MMPHYPKFDFELFFIILGVSLVVGHAYDATPLYRTAIYGAMSLVFVLVLRNRS